MTGRPQVNGLTAGRRLAPLVPIAVAIALAIAAVLGPTSSGDASGAPTSEGRKADSKGQFCRGERATIVGTSEGENLRGTPDDDVIVGRGGGDSIYSGRGGRDLICGGPGGDWLDGRTEADRIFGGRGDDLLWGDSGNDRLHGGVGGDELFGWGGKDLCHGGSPRRDGPHRGDLAEKSTPGKPSSRSCNRFWGAYPD